MYGGRRGVDRCQDEIEVMSMIDLLLLKRDTLKYVQDMRTERNGMRPLRPLCCIVYWWVHGLKGYRK